MTEFTVKLAGVPVRIRAIHRQMKDFLREYLSEEEPEFSLEIFPEDLLREREKDAQTRAAEGRAPFDWDDEYLETLAVYRKLAETLLDRNVLLFHGSAVEVDGQAYLFTARSGTGKSTHTRLWREAFGQRAVMINDDKPLLRVEEDAVLVFGTPWNGKHGLSTCGSAPLKALCILSRAKENRIEPVSLEDAFPVLFQQCYRPQGQEKTARVLELLERLGNRVRLYRLGCNMDPEAALVAYQGMQEE